MNMIVYDVIDRETGRFVLIHVVSAAAEYATAARPGWERFSAAALGLPRPDDGHPLWSRYELRVTHYDAEKDWNPAKPREHYWRPL